KGIPDAVVFKNKFLFLGSALIVACMIWSALVYANTWDKELYVLGFALAIFGIAFLMSWFYLFQERADAGIVHVTHDFTTMPRTMLQLALVQFFSWFALFSMWIYTTPAVTSHIFHT